MPVMTTTALAMATAAATKNGNGIKNGKYGNGNGKSRRSKTTVVPLTNGDVVPEVLGALETAGTWHGATVAPGTPTT